jgi:phage terminase small subunit
MAKQSKRSSDPNRAIDIMIPKSRDVQYAIFAARYLATGNATQAARDAGYSRKTAYAQGSRLLKHAEVQKLLLRGVERAELSAARTLEETRRNAFSDIGALFDECGNLKPIHTLPAEVRSTIASVEVVIKNAAGGDGHTDTIHKVKLWSKDKALELLAKHFALLVERMKLETDETLLKLLDEGRKRNAQRKGSRCPLAPDVEAGYRLTASRFAETAL